MVVSGANNAAQSLPHGSAGRQATSGPRDDTVPEFLARIGLEQYKSIFDAQMIQTMEELMPMGTAQLEQMGIMAAGHRTKIITERTRGQWKAASKK